MAAEDGGEHVARVLHRPVQERASDEKPGGLETRVHNTWTESGKLGSCGLESAEQQGREPIACADVHVGSLGEEGPQDAGGAAVSGLDNDGPVLPRGVHISMLADQPAPKGWPRFGANEVGQAKLVEGGEQSGR